MVCTGRHLPHKYGSSARRSGPRAAVEVRLDKQARDIRLVGEPGADFAVDVAVRSAGADLAQRARCPVFAEGEPGVLALAGIVVALEHDPQRRRARRGDQAGEQGFDGLAVLDAVGGAQEMGEMVDTRGPEECTIEHGTSVKPRGDARHPESPACARCCPRVRSEAPQWPHTRPSGRTRCGAGVYPAAAAEDVHEGCGWTPAYW